MTTVADLCVTAPRVLEPETSAHAVAAQAEAAVKARYALAVARPRSWDQVRQDLLRECRRPSFAAVARYSKPIGARAVEGPSIRFAEAALRAATNVLVETPAIYDDAEKRIVRVAVTDLEANVSYSRDVTISKTVERSAVRDGQEVLGKRTNSQGRPVYVVRATDDDLLNKELALVSKAIRNSGLRVLPGDLVEEGMEVCARTLADQAATDPEGERKRLADAFAGVGVQPQELAAYLGHGLETLQPRELVELRAIYSAVRDGEATWRDVLDAKPAARDNEGTPTAPPAKASKTEQLKERIAARSKAIRPSGSDGPEPPILPVVDRTKAEHGEEG